MTRTQIGILISVVVLSVWRLGRWLERSQENELDTWAARELSTLLATTGKHEAQAIEESLAGRTHDASLQGWIDAQESGAELAFRRVEKRYNVELVVFFKDGRRVLERACGWEELPEEVRGRFLGSEREAHIPWRAPWKKGVA